MQRISCRMLLAQISCAVTLLSFTPPVTYAWGTTGHRVVARIAAKHLTTKTKAALSAILMADEEDLDQCKQLSSLGDKLACISTWPDEIRDAKKFPQYASTGVLHYVN